MSKVESKSSNIPLARERLMMIADDLGEAVQAGWIREIVEGLMRQAPFVRRTRAKHPIPTFQKVRDVKAMFHANPSMHMDEIGRLFDMNQGRVSEIINNKWDYPHGSLLVKALERLAAKNSKAKP